MQEGMGRIVDRRREFLVAADTAIVTARRRILDIVATPESLAAFREVIESGYSYSARPLDVVSEVGDVTAFLDHFKGDLFGRA